MPPDSTSNSIVLDRYRNYLALLARWHWNPRLQGKLDPSDVVQQTMALAWQGLDNYRGSTEAELRAWLRCILTRYLTDLARNFNLEKRDLAKERSLDAIIADSSVRLEMWLDDQQSSPQERAERNEQLLQLAEAIAALPAAQQEAVTLFHLHEMSVAGISQIMNRSTTAVAGLLKRGLRTLRTQFDKGE
jgi:RNA polymerase sigma-70 factor, ECF subfamily